jgi:hypothetical protein
MERAAVGVDDGRDVSCIVRRFEYEGGGLERPFLRIDARGASAEKEERQREPSPPFVS